MKTKDELIAEIVELADNNCILYIDTASFGKDVQFLLADYDIVKKPTDWVICPHCLKYKKLQGDGVVHQLCECGT